MKIIDILKDIFAPKKCYSCKKEWHFLCKNCLEKLWYFEESCYICKEYSKNFEKHFYCKNNDFYLDKIIILTHYRHFIIKKLIKDAKFYHKKDILDDFSIYLWDLILKYIDKNKNDLIFITPPMYFLKKIKRWYNVGEVLIKFLNKKYQINYDFNLIKKVKNTTPQSHLDKLKRLENLENAFKVNEKLLKKYKNKTFVIIDDVVSTKTTINEIAKLLKKFWVKNIIWLCISSD